MADEKVGTFQTRRINWQAQQHQQAWESTAGEDREDSFLVLWWKTLHEVHNIVNIQQRC